MGRMLVKSSLLVVIVFGMTLGGVRAKGTAAQTKRANLSSRQIATARARILVYTNQERARSGLLPLKPSTALNYLAEVQSAIMCAALRKVDATRTANKCSLANFSHESRLFPDGWQMFSDRLKRANLDSGAENIACRTLEPDLDRWARTIVRGWMNSKSGHHKDNILSRKYRFLGVGVVGCMERIGYATQVFSDRPGSIRP